MTLRNPGTNQNFDPDVSLLKPANENAQFGHLEKSSGFSPSIHFFILTPSDRNSSEKKHPSDLITPGLGWLVALGKRNLHNFDTIFYNQHKKIKWK